MKVIPIGTKWILFLVFLSFIVTSSSLFCGREEKINTSNMDVFNLKMMPAWSEEGQK
jgi:hypothetical protein